MNVTRRRTSAKPTGRRTQFDVWLPVGLEDLGQPTKWRFGETWRGGVVSPAGWMNGNGPVRGPDALSQPVLQETFAVAG